MDNNKKKILFCITLPDIGGAQIVVYNIISSLNQSKYDITLVTSREGFLTNKVKKLNEKSGSKIVITIIPSIKREISLSHDIATLYLLYKLMKTNNFDIVHLHSSKVGILGRFAAWAAKTPMIVFTAHGWGINEHQGKIKQFLFGLAEKMASRLCTRIVCVSNYDFSKGIRKKWIKKGNSCVIYNGVENFISKEMECSNENKAAKKSYLIGTIMRLEEPKDPIFTIQVFREVNLRFGSNIRLMIVGDGRLRHECIKIIDDLGLDADIDLLGECEDAKNKISDFDIFTLFSKSEGLPISIIEAMLVGKPIVASNVGGIPELVKDSKNGFLVKEQNILEAAQYIEILLKNLHLREKMGSRSKKIAMLNFTKENMVSAYEDIYLSRG